MPKKFNWLEFAAKAAVVISITVAAAKETNVGARIKEGLAALDASKVEVEEEQVIH